MMSDIDNLIVKNEEEIKALREREELLSVLSQYVGEDKVVSVEEYKKELEEDKGHPRVFLSPFPKLNKLIEGFREGELIVVSGPTGEGKSTFLQTLTTHFVEKDTNCLWFSYEMHPRDLFNRFGKELPIFYLPKKMKESKISWIEERVWESIAKFDIKVVFIDHLHYLLDLKLLSQSRSVSLTIGNLMRELKRLALKTETVIFLTAHLTKLELTEAPSLGDIRDSSFISQEADFVGIIWRHRQKDKESPTGFRRTGEAHFILEKNRRSGRLGMVKLTHHDGYFSELAEDYEEL